MDGEKSRRESGLAAEGVAARYLQSRNITIIERNVYNRGGEIDLVGLDGRTVVFFEVRFRSRNAQVSPLESISWKKCQSLRKAAAFYLHRRGLTDSQARIDVVAVMPGTTSRYRIQWIKNAIEAGN